MIDYERISSAHITINGIQVPVMKIFETVDGQHKEVYSSGPFIPTIITYNANGEFFEDGSATNIVEYKKEKGVITIISGEEKTLSNSGRIFLGWYLDQECTDGNEFDLNNSIKSGKVITVYACWMSKEEQNLITDFNYIKNKDGTYTITNWKGTYQGVSSKELIIPDFSKIIL